MNDIIVHTDPHLFRIKCQKIYDDHQPEYSLIDGMLSAAQNGRLKNSVTMIECKLFGKTIAIAMQAGLHLMVTSEVNRFAKLIAEYFIENEISVPGVIGPETASYEFAKMYCDLKKCKMKLAMNQRLYELKKVIWPTTISGEFRLMNDKDISEIEKWTESYFLETIPWELPTKEEIRQMTLARVPREMTYVWIDKGTLVSMANLARATETNITVNGVYTPPQFRRKGYAAALVAAVSNEGLKKGKKSCVLYTDLSNPTSNSIYQKIGYRPVADSKNYIFEF